MCVVDDEGIESDGAAYSEEPEPVERLPLLFYIVSERLFVEFAVDRDLKPE